MSKNVSRSLTGKLESEVWRMLLNASRICKEYGIQEIFQIDSLQIEDGDRIGLVGRNGVGKSTLLGTLSGRIPLDNGVVTRNCEIAEILQSGESEGTADGKYLSRMRLKGCAGRSGGERTRMAIAAAFARHTPLLFADEPTTNLDREGIVTLEKMLIGYRGAVLLISHDRMLLDNVCNQIWELEDGKLRVFPGNYTAWLQQRQQERAFQQFEYEQYREEKKRLEKNIHAVQQRAKTMTKRPKKMSHSEWQLYKGIASVQQGHVQSRARAIESRLEHLEVKRRPKDLPDISMKLSEAGRIRGKNAAKIEDLTVSYEGKVILDHVSLCVESGKKTFLTGENGSGKSTLIRNLMQGTDGTFLTSDAKAGYFSQDQEILDAQRTVLENVKETAVVPESICRAVLTNLYMSRDDMGKKVSVLSGGERVKTALAKVLVSGCNFLVLDEPSNHMDLYTMEGLERLLADYDGTALIVSHDRKFVEKLADQIYELRDGKVFRMTPHPILSPEFPEG